MDIISNDVTSEIVFYTDASVGHLKMAEVPILTNQVVLYTIPAAGVSNPNYNVNPVTLATSLKQPSAVKVDTIEELVLVTEISGKVYKIPLQHIIGNQTHPLTISVSTLEQRIVVWEGYTHSRLTSMCMFDSIPRSSFLGYDVSKSNIGPGQIDANADAMSAASLVAENTTTDGNKRDPTSAFKWNQQ